MPLLAGLSEADTPMIAAGLLVVLVFLAGLVWCGAVQLVRIARSLQRIADMMAKKGEA